MTEAREFRSPITEAIYPSLRGHSVYLVESQGLVELYGAACILDQEMRAESGFQVPEDLLGYMNERGLESAIMHVSAFYEEKPTIEAHQAGKKIVIIRRRFPIIADEVEMNRRLDAQGIPYSLKTIDLTGFNRALELLAKLFEEADTANSI